MAIFQESDPMTKIELCNMLSSISLPTRLNFLHYIPVNNNNKCTTLLNISNVKPSSFHNISPTRKSLVCWNKLNKFVSPFSLICKAMTTNTSTVAESKPFGVLFVCLGNICRSPTAEAVFRNAVQKRGLTSSFKIDSAGTINYHEGQPSDPRMKAAAKKRGVEITSISRPIQPDDFSSFDLILAMDKQNKADILKAFEEWKKKYDLPAEAFKKVKLMCSYCKQCKETEVPDPYYGGPQGFEKVLDILNDACESLLDEIVENHFK